MLQGKIYMLSSPHHPKVYVGSTIQPMSKRLSRHRGKANTCRSRELFEKCGESVQVDILEHVDVHDRKELLQHELRYLKKYEGKVVNKIMPLRNRKQHYQDNIDKMREYHRNRYAEKALKNGGDGAYRQLKNYYDKKDLILRRSALMNAWKHNRMPFKSTMIKHNLTEDEVKQFIKDMNDAT